MLRSRSARGIPLAALALLVGAGACAYTPRPSIRDQIATALDSAGRDTTALHEPVVTIATDHDYGRYRRIVTRLRATDDAYFVVVNVSPAGYAQVVYPEDPRDVARLRAGRTYILPSQFVGHEWESLAPPGALGKRFVWYGQSAYARSGATGPGYVFVVASRLPLDLEALATAGYFDGVEVGSSLTDMEPDAVIPEIALLAVGFTARGGLAVDVARYSGYDAVTYAAAPFQSAYNTGYCDAGYGIFGPSSITAWDLAYSRSGCSPYELRRYREMRELPRVIWPPVTPDSLLPPWERPMRPRARPDTTSVPTSRGVRAALATRDEEHGGTTTRRRPEVTTDDDVVVLRRERREAESGRPRMRERGDDPRQRYQRPPSDVDPPRRRAADERGYTPERPHRRDGGDRPDDGGIRSTPIERAPAPPPRSEPAHSPPPSREPAQPSPSPASARPDTGKPA